MITRLDHVVIAVRDLDEGMRRYRELGFDVRPGGRHTGRGTHNAIVRFGLDYLELIAVYDEAEANASGPHGQVLVDFLRRHEGGLVGYALATTDIQQDAERLASAGLAAEGPFAMERMRPDGRRLSWRLLVPGGVPWRRPWPFFIQWDIADDERLSWEQPGTHPNGTTGISGIVLVVRDLEGAIALYQCQIGLALRQQDVDQGLIAPRATFQVGAVSIALLAPAGDSPAGQVLDDAGEGPFAVTLAVKDLEQGRAALARSGAGLEPVAHGSDALLIAPEAAMGARIVLATGS
jgi:catechol 2,3-dioxygenase-like lactoylglutathione lyase family enzyme